MEEPKDFQEPQDYSDDHNRIQDRLNGARHGHEAVYQPEQNTHYHQNHDQLK